MKYGIPCVIIGGLMTVTSMTAGFLLPTVLGEGGSDASLPLMVGNIPFFVGFVGLFMTVYGIWALYMEAATGEYEPEELQARHKTPTPLTFAQTMRQSSGTISRYLNRPGIAVDHPMKDLPAIINELGALEESIPTKKRNLIALTATKIAESVADDRSFETSGPDPKLAGEIVEKLGALRNDLNRDDTQQIDLTLTVLSRQLNRL